MSLKGEGWGGKATEEGGDPEQRLWTSTMEGSFPVLL